MSEPKLLLRRPLPPKVETVLFIPKRKDHKGDHDKDTESKEMSGDSRSTDVQLPISTSTHQVLLSLPDFISCSPSNLDYGSGSQSLSPESSYLHLDSIKKSFVIPLQRSGPPSFPLHKRRIPLRLKFPALKFHRLFLQSDFILKGFTTDVSHVSRRAKSEYKKPIISHLNYEVHSRQLIQELQRTGQAAANTILLPSAGFPFAATRIPDTEMQLEKFLEQELETSQTAEISEAAKEKLTFLHVEWKKRKEKMVTYSDTLFDSDNLALVSGSGCRYQLSPDDEQRELLIKAEMAVYCCLMHKKPVLNLKAYFLPRLPDLSPVADFLLYLNLSFNNFRLFPTEVCDIKNLQVLKLRNNPIKFIPEEIKKLKCLKTLVISFNLLTELPSWLCSEELWGSLEVCQGLLPEEISSKLFPQRQLFHSYRLSHKIYTCLGLAVPLFALPALEYLDAAYNKIEYISNAISNVRNLKILILEGNLLHFLPCGLLSLQLKRLKVENNFLHLLFWNEFRFQPQPLTEMAALCFVQNNLRQRYPEIPEDIQKLLCSCGTCDCCKGPLYGYGFGFLRIYRNIYGLRLPYLFSACSIACYTKFVT